MSNNWIKKLRQESDDFLRPEFAAHADAETSWWKQAEVEVRGTQTAPDIGQDARSWLEQEADRARERIKRRQVEIDRKQEETRRTIAEKLRLFQYSVPSDDRNWKVITSPERAAEHGVSSDGLQAPGIPDFFGHSVAQTAMVDVLVEAGMVVSLSTVVKDINGQGWTVWRCHITDGRAGGGLYPASAEDLELWTSVCYAVAAFVANC